MKQTITLSPLKKCEIALAEADSGSALRAPYIAFSRTLNELSVMQEGLERSLLAAIEQASELSKATYVYRRYCAEDLAKFESFKQMLYDCRQMRERTAEVASGLSTSIKNAVRAEKAGRERA